MPLSVPAEVFIRRGRERNTEIRGCKVLCVHTARSFPLRQVTVLCVMLI